ncbi:MAG: insulinase family protein [Acidobacteria bacterium]|nr:MAG: insulinase family protein [Acidobacteriota bacterium]REK10324.1 MAG: insulinase family protein [Acidobacteriota bacterium]
MTRQNGDPREPLECTAGPGSPASAPQRPIASRAAAKAPGGAPPEPAGSGRAPERGAESAADSAAFWGAPVRTAELANGLRLVVAEDAGKPLVSTALWYGVGARDERPGESGLAHFLEHMMFKGSEKYGAGEVDRLTQGLGGSNNAFTSHDATVYTFNLPAARWRTALEIEADRLQTLLLDPDEVDSEREVVLEEIAMYESDPWDALDQAVVRELFAGHPYAEPVLGHRERMRLHGPDDLRAFQRAHYRLDNAVLAVAGACDLDELAGEAERIFAGVGRRSPSGARAGVAPAVGERQRGRVERRRGETARLLFAAQAPGACEPAHPVWRMAIAVLTAGRGSRLHRRLVEEERCATWINGDLSETVGPATASVMLEVPPGVEPERPERVLWEEIQRLADRSPDDAELRRARRMMKADFVFAHERAARQAVALGAEEMLFGRGHYQRLFERLEEVRPEDLQAVGAELLAGRSVVGWSLPTVAGGSQGTLAEASSPGALA